MLSRIADSLFWMTRYVERTDGILRMLKINFITSLDRTGEGGFSWQPVLKVFAHLPDEQLKAFSHSSDDVLRYMITSRENNNSIRNIIARARENARGMQDHITKEAWECMNEFYHYVNSPDIEKAIERDEQVVMLSRLIERCLLYYGVMEVTMPRGQGWNYMNLGKFIERGIQTVDILDVKFNDISYNLDDPMDIPYYRNLLLSLSGYELYLKSYRTGLDSQNVVDMALLNTDFPRSVLYCLIRLDRTIRGMTHENMEATPQLQKIIGRLRSAVEYSDMDTIAEKGLHDFLAEVKNDLYGFSNALSRSYFAYN
ncbi:MAG: alpha-E domain-containing protein [Saprospiraceae bacterium]|nr:alpha-E domain-containing protein [Saprospiraceae bacterium]